MSIQPKIPFQLTAQGAVAVDTDPNVQISKRVRTLVSTNPGERVNRAPYGVPLVSFLFEPEDDAEQQRLEELVTAALASWEPGVRATVINPIWNKRGDAILAADVQYVRVDEAKAPIALAQYENVAEITEGGAVIETVSG
jgi:phage baseplate assembly protein W